MKDYVLTIGIDRFYLTKDEADFYLSSVEKGKEHVFIAGIGALGTKFRSLVHKNVLDGKWQCELGNWHTKGARCYCNDEYEVLASGKMRIKEKN